MKKLLLLFFGIGAFCLPLKLHASLDVGEGARPCKEYAKKSLNKKSSYIHWVQGFFSAFNALDPKTQSILGDAKDYHWVREWLDTYCKGHPDTYFGEAVRVLVEELYPNRVPKVAENPTSAPISIRIE